MRSTGPALDRYDVTRYDVTKPEDAAKRLSGADIAFINKTVLSRETLEKCPDLKLICVIATGYNTVDTAAARELPESTSATRHPTAARQSLSTR